MKNKLRGGYESSCLLLVALAEAKETVDHTGNPLIDEVDTEYKRFTAFRKKLKALTQKAVYSSYDPEGICWNSTHD